MRGGMLLAVAVLLGVAACSGDDATSPGTTRPSTTAAPTPTPAPATTSTSAGAPTTSTAAASTTGVPSGRAPRIPTSSATTGQQAMLHLELRYDASTGCIFAGDQLPVWPPGYTVSLDPLGVRDAHGNMVAAVGGPTYEIVGGHTDARDLEDESFADCAAAVGGTLVLVGAAQASDGDRVEPRPSAACGQDASEPGETMVSAVEGARAGRYLEFLPSVYDGTVPRPLVLDLHGYGESIEIHREMSNVIAKGEEKSFIVVTPEADDPVPRWDATIGSADTTFLIAVLDQVVAAHCVDENRVYVTGLSNGAFMASVMACQLPDRIAAIAPVAGLRDPAGCQIDDPVPVISFHGTADTFVSYDGGLGASVADLPTDDGGTIGTAVVGGDGPTVEETAAAWAVRNGCAAQPPVVEAVSAEVDRLRYPSCPAAGQVDLYRINGGGHAWPGSAFSQAIEPIVGHTTMTIDATDLIWQFFDANPRRP